MPSSGARVKKQANLDKKELLQLSKEELVERIRRLEAANLNFRNILAKRNWAEQRANDKFSVGGCPGEEVSGGQGGGGGSDGSGVGGQGEGGGGGSKKRKQKPFDFALYNKRHVALHVAYFGWDWHGYVVQVWLIFFPG